MLVTPFARYKARERIQRSSGTVMDNEASNVGVNELKIPLDWWGPNGIEHVWKVDSDKYKVNANAFKFT